MKTQLFVATVVSSLIGLSVASPIYALDVKARVGLDAEARRESKEEKQESKQGFFGNLFKNRFVRIINGEVTAKNDTTLTVKKDDTSYTVNIEGKTQFRRKFWGKSDLDEVSVGNIVNITGTWTDDAHTTILARQIRNLSIQKRFGVFFGVIKSLSANGWVMSTISLKRADQAVTVSADTKFINRKEETIVQSDIKVGDRVRVHGLWDSSANTVTEVKKVKNFSLPVQVKVTPTVTVAVTPTTVPTSTPTSTPTVAPTATPTP